MHIVLSGQAPCTGPAYRLILEPCLLVSARMGALGMRMVFPGLASHIHVALGFGFLGNCSCIALPPALLYLLHPCSRVSEGLEGRYRIALASLMRNGFQTSKREL